VKRRSYRINLPFRMRRADYGTHALRRTKATLI
jgi:hypothetical protein